MKKAFIFSLLILLTVISYSGETKKKVFVIESYHAEYAWDESYREGIEEGLKKSADITYFEMNTKRIPKEEHQKMADIAWAKFEEIKPDLVIIGDDAALKFLGEKFGATKIPVLYLGINNNPRNYFKSSLPDNLTGVLERPIVKRNLNIINGLIPNSKNCLILFDTSITSEIVLAEQFENKSSSTVLTTNYDLKLVKDFVQWKSLVTTSKGKYDYIITGLYQTILDETGKVIPSDDVIEWTSANTPIPIFGYWDFSVGKTKSIGGLVLLGKEQGKIAAKMATDIFNGTDIKKIRPVFENQGVYLFSKTQMTKWKINLPDDLKKRAVLIE